MRLEAGMQPSRWVLWVHQGIRTVADNQEKTPFLDDILGFREEIRITFKLLDSYEGKTDSRQIKFNMKTEPNFSE